MTTWPRYLSDSRSLFTMYSISFDTYADRTKTSCHESETCRPPRTCRPFSALMTHGGQERMGGGGAVARGGAPPPPAHALYRAGVLEVCACVLREEEVMSGPRAGGVEQEVWCLKSALAVSLCSTYARAFSFEDLCLYIYIYIYKLHTYIHTYIIIFKNMFLKGFTRGDPWVSPFMKQISTGRNL